MIGVAWLLTAALSPGGQAPVVVDLGCGTRRRASDVEIVSRAVSVALTTQCVDDTGPSRSATVATRFSLPAAAASREWIAALAPTAPVRAVARREGTAQTYRLTRGNAACALVRIVALVKQPLPPRFLGDDGDWQATTDILATRDCGAVAVRAGNRIALFDAAASGSVRLGNFRIEVRRGAADGDDRRNAHHHGRGRG